MSALAFRTVGELLERAEAQFESAQLAYGHGTDNAFDDACVLLREAMNVPYDTDLTQALWTAAVDTAAAQRFEAFANRRVTERIPAPYITGKAYVQGIGLHW
jgi:ribosomal protein L3 glutamine methyltransferase